MTIFKRIVNSRNILLIYLLSIIIMVISIPITLGEVPKENLNFNDEKIVKPKQFVEIEGYLTPGMYKDYGYPNEWTPFYLNAGEKVGITIQWNPPAKMRVGIVYTNGKWADYTAPVQGSEVKVTAPKDGLYYVRIQNVDNNLSTQYSGWFIIY